MRRAKKVIITCAPTGATHTPTMSAHLPLTPKEIAEEAIAAADAGAAILHLHARDPKSGRPSQDPSLFKEFLPVIKQRTGAVINLTTGGGVGMTMEERLAPSYWAEPELTSLNMGSMNFGLFKVAEKFNSWKFDWEEPYLRNTKDFIHSNTFTQIERIMRDLGEGFGTKFEFECYDVGHLYTLVHFAEQKLVKPPFFIQCVFGVLGGIGADEENLVHMRAIADKLFGNDYYLSVLAAGKDQMRFVTMSAIMGGNVRVGLEDSLYISKGKLAVSNADQVRKIKSILEALSLEAASPEEARQMLDLKGGDRVAF